MHLREDMDIYVGAVPC